MERLQREQTIVVITSSVIYLLYKISVTRLFKEMYFSHVCLALFDQQSKYVEFTIQVQKKKI